LKCWWIIVFFTAITVGISNVFKKLINAAVTICRVTSPGTMTILSSCDLILALLEEHGGGNIIQCDLMTIKNKPRSTKRCVTCKTRKGRQCFGPADCEAGLCIETPYKLNY
jgi:hypothetical protein